jgi:DNA-directed RNA polymerase specialized sigma24 family protein
VAGDGVAPAKGLAALARNEAAEASPVSAAQFEEFHRRLFLPLVRRAMWRHRMSGEDARDIVQEAFLLALGKLKPGGDPACWFIKVVDHLCVNLRRKAARRNGLQARWGGVPTAGDDWDTTMETWLNSLETGSDS